MFLLVMKIMALQEVLSNILLLCPKLDTWSPLASRQPEKEIVYFDSLSKSDPFKKKKKKKNLTENRKTGGKIILYQ